jgi:N6-adenosine-specific RNA methylase IME4
MPSANKIELFARNNNLREGWLSLGNQLGPNYIEWKNTVYCDICKDEIELGVKRFKSKTKAN